MRTKQLWTCGIDPGYACTGIALTKGDDLVEWALHSLPPGESSEWVRASSLASAIVASISEWVEDHEIECLRVAVEVPFYNHNAQTLMKQVRLLQEIQSGLTVVIGTLVPDTCIVEVVPSTAKKQLTGDSQADKKAMAAAAAHVMPPQLTKFEHRHTLADAYALALCATRPGVDVASDLYTPWTLVDESKGGRS